MIEALVQFHFLRPLWLLAVVPCCLLVYYFWRQKSSSANWHSAINQQLLEHLIDGQHARQQRWPWLLVLLASLIACIALAGPSWKKLPQPVHQRQDALVIVLDLSLSMLAEDIRPSRLVRARHKVLDILKQRNEGLTALIAYSGDAHVVSPLTEDTATVANLTPALSPEMMPLFGSDPVTALRLAKQLFSNAGIPRGRVLLISDGITAADVEDIDNDLQSHGLELSILGIGTADGAPIPTQDGFLKDNSGNIIVPQLSRNQLETLARNNNGRYTDISLNDQDIQFLLPDPGTMFDEQAALSEREFDQWHDRGPLVAILLLPLALLAFRRGWLLLIPLCVLLPAPDSLAQEASQASQQQPTSKLTQYWHNLWQTGDQQGQALLEQGEASAAAQHFNNPQWKASAQYRAKDYQAAAETFGQSESASDHYNRGNALARAGQLNEAIKAYEQALEKNPDIEDAQFNKSLVEQLKQQQQNQQDQSQRGDGQEDQQHQNDQQDQQDQQQGDQQGEGQQDKQQSSSQQDSTQQDSSQQNRQDDQQGEQPPPEEQGSEEQKAEQQRTQSDTPDSEEQSQQQVQSQQQQADAEEQEQNAQQAEPRELSPEEQQKQQAMEQWLRKIPDDPSGLLRRKFEYEHRQRQQQDRPEREQPLW